ncbi:S-adenosylmethionine-binding protein [Cupriavidus sp. 2MCAB6]|uniref:ParB/RepB/Spo0J family partition protein n=1 Tax=Cupriavidus sp. 2MCAB6 TaxID=3232981 RepID=UPI003F90733E
MREIRLHPLCTLFPRMSGADFDALKADIAQHGVRQPIVMHDGLILDGGNRYRACMELGMEPRFEEFEGDGIVAFVLSANLHRRHMTPGQQAAIVASAQDWAQAHVPGGDGRNQHEGAATLPGPPLVSVADRAAQSGASERTQRMADKVAREAPELAKKVAQGEVSLPAAVKQLAQTTAAAEASDPAPSVAPKPAAKTATKPPARTPELAANDAQPDPNANRLQQLEELLAETMSENAKLLSEVVTLRAVIAADDRVAASLAELQAARAEAAASIEQKEAEITALRERNNGLMNEKNEAVRIAKALQRKQGRAAA